MLLKFLKYYIIQHHMFYQIFYNNVEILLTLDMLIFSRCRTWKLANLVRLFRYADPVLWNSLLNDFRKCSNFNQFKKNHGTLLTVNVYNLTPTDISQYRSIRLVFVCWHVMLIFYTFIIGFPIYFQFFFLW